MQQDNKQNTMICCALPHHLAGNTVGNIVDYCITSNLRLTTLHYDFFLRRNGKLCINCSMQSYLHQILINYLANKFITLHVASLHA